MVRITGFEAFHTLPATVFSQTPSGLMISYRTMRCVNWLKLLTFQGQSLSPSPGSDVFETSVTFNQLTRLTARGDIINFSRRECLTSYIVIAYTNQPMVSRVSRASSVRGDVVIANHIRVDSMPRRLVGNTEGYTGGGNVIVRGGRGTFIHMTPFHGLIVNN
jgi:hypothetical protein